MWRAHFFLSCGRAQSFRSSLAAGIPVFTSVGGLGFPFCSGGQPPARPSPAPCTGPDRVRPEPGLSASSFDDIHPARPSTARSTRVAGARALRRAPDRARRPPTGLSPDTVMSPRGIRTCAESPSDCQEVFPVTSRPTILSRPPEIRTGITSRLCGHASAIELLPSCLHRLRQRRARTGPRTTICRPCLPSRRDLPAHVRCKGGTGPDTGWLPGGLTRRPSTHSRS
jgi:hypothetical protein